MFRKISSKLFGHRSDVDPLIAVNNNTKPLNLTSQTSKVFGFPDKISTNMAFDKYQGLIAFGTSTNIIKIVSLKGYE